MAVILIGIDDTDNPTSRGTGHLARQLYRECENRGMQPLGITRHQFLLDPAIPYTSHNSGACIAVATDNGTEAADFAFDFVAQHSAEGSDPGVCIARMDAVTPDMMKFAYTATSKVLKIEDAFNVVRAVPVKLRGLGGTCQGIIGAAASVGLRAEGNEGRFIDLPGLRELSGQVDSKVFEKLGIAIKHINGNRHPMPGDKYDTLEWVRPRIVNGKPLLVVEWSEQNNAWIPIDRSKSRPLE
jgi:hypothetical protein